MLERIIRASIAHRWLVLLLVLALSGLGVWNYSRLHHQCPSADQYRGTGLLANGGRAARHLPG